MSDPASPVVSILASFSEVLNSIPTAAANGKSNNEEVIKVTKYVHIITTTDPKTGVQLAPETSVYQVHLSNLLTLQTRKSTV